jgi:hypothetical protein
MKHRLLLLLLITVCTQNKEIFCSQKKNHIILEEKKDFKKILKISHLLENGLTLFQAHHAYELNLNREQALIATQKNLLKTATSCLKGSVMRNDAELQAYFYNQEKKLTQEFLNMTSLIKDVAQTVIAAQFRGYLARHNLKTGK